MQDFIDFIHRELLPSLQIESIHPHNPVVVHHHPEQWQLLGAGSHAVIIFQP